MRVIHALEGSRKNMEHWTLALSRHAQRRGLMHAGNLACTTRAWHPSCAGVHAVMEGTMMLPCVAHRLFRTCTSHGTHYGGHAHRRPNRREVLHMCCALHACMACMYSAPLAHLLEVQQAAAVGVDLFRNFLRASGGWTSVRAEKERAVCRSAFARIVSHRQNSPRPLHPLDSCLSPVVRFRVPW